MNTPEEDLQRIEIDINRARELIDAKAAMEKLQKYKPFRELILEGYCEKYPLSLVQQLGFPQNETDERQALINVSLRGIGEFQAYMMRVIQAGAEMERALDQMEDERDTLQAETL